MTRAGLFLPWALAAFAGRHDLVVLTANRAFDHYFHIRILDAETGALPAGLLVSCADADTSCGE